uniref:Uncharacterized protein n=1 Tax=Arundo donax TaxID=35708 RepID=A0A0A9GXE5_ARUDO
MGSAIFALPSYSNTRSIFPLLHQLSAPATTSGPNQILLLTLKYLQYIAQSLKSPYYTVLV